ncbi:hypothetical protein ScPMuIL_006242 [Solemya velum]
MRGAVESRMDNQNGSATNCSDEFPYTEEYYEELSVDVTFMALFSLCAFLTTFLVLGFLEHVWHFHKNHEGDDKRNKQVYLLGIYPVVAVMAFLAIAVPRSTILTDLLASVYLSVAVYQFLTLTILHHGGIEGMLSKFEEQTISFCTPPLCCVLCCLRKIPFTERTLNVLRVFVLQLVIIRPILMLTAAVLWTDGQYTPGDTSPSTPSLYITVINAVSTLLAMYGLVVTFRSSKLHLKEERLGMKFAALQLAIVIVNLQNVIVGILATKNIPACIGMRGSKIRGSNAHHMLLIVEMLLLGALARFAYRVPFKRKLSSDCDHPKVIQENNDAKTPVDGISEQMHDATIGRSCEKLPLVHADSFQKGHSYH